VSGEELDLESMRTAFAQPDDPGDRASCPDDGEIWDAVHGALPADRLREVVDHVATCAACAESWRIALQLERRDPAAAFADDRAADATDAGTGTGIGRATLAATRRRPRFWLFGGAAAAAAAAILAAVGITRQPGDGTAAAPPTRRRRGGRCLTPRCRGRRHGCAGAARRERPTTSP
jgi:anti-sigma factor RsiW